MKLEKEVILRFPFSDPHQQQIYSGLEDIVGPGPAAFYYDACFLMENPGLLKTHVHVVAHLLRELESAMREISLRIAVRPKTLAKRKNNKGAKQRKKESKKSQIRRILASLGIPEGSREGQAWFKLVEELHGLAHRKELDAPRPLEEINDHWEKINLLLGVLVPALRDRFFDWTKTPDKLLEIKTKQADGDIKRLIQVIQEIPNNLRTRQYFFDRLENPEWLQPLWEKGFFKHPPQAKRDEEGSITGFPLWPEARYLARMAKHKPELVAEIISQMDDTDNAWVQTNLLDAMLAMPPRLSAPFVNKVKRWAEQPDWLVPEKIGEVIAHWARGGLADEALEVAKVLFDVIQDKQCAQTRPEPRVRFDMWYYEKILKENYPELVCAAGMPALELLCRLLDKAIKPYWISDDIETSEDFSAFSWRPAIEEHYQNPTNTIEGALVSAVRDAAEHVVRCEKATVEEVVNFLESQRWKVFRRIALHLLRVFADKAQPLVVARLINRKNFDDIGVLHEYALLLRSCFSKLMEEDQAEILAWIENGLDVERLKQRLEEQTGSTPSDEEVVQYKERWQLDWLARIGLENLPKEWQERYRNLAEKYGEPDHPEFLVYTKDGFYGLASPKTEQELKAMSVNEIVEFLKKWVPEEDVLWQTREALGRELATVVQQDPGRFADLADQFEGLDPTYIRAVLNGFRGALEQGKTFNWRKILDLCKWIVSQPLEIPGRQVRVFDADPDWGWTRGAIADLLYAGLENRPGSIPIELREKVWAILEALMKSPVSAEEHVNTYDGSYMDPATLSLNTIRGKALHAVILYALWVRRHLEKEPDSKERLLRGFKEMPEVVETLEAHLDTNQEPSLAVRAVYGQWFPWLVVLDPNWARDNAERIFPRSQNAEAFFEAAWNTYVIFCKPYDNVLNILRQQYRQAVDKIGIERNTRWMADPDEKLAEHLMAFYWRGKLLLDDDIFVAFWEKAPDNIRAHALRFIGSALKQTKEKIPEEILSRLKQLWEWRLKIADERGLSQFEKEIEAFGWWFVSEKFDLDWSLDQLVKSLELVHRIKPSYDVLKALAKMGKASLPRSIKVVRMIAEGDQNGWEIYVSRKDIRAILQAGLQDPIAEEESKKVINYLGSRGFIDFKDLLQ
ncbi:MAG: hypothetical protein QHH26_11225 [Armatimonadota bacterium]|nr:hypothetical protein [Armatimonadota bacterium]